jgi:hypothetical protein
MFSICFRVLKGNTGKIFPCFKGEIPKKVGKKQLFASISPQHSRNATKSL